MDMVAYMGVITEIDESDPQTIHRLVFEDLERELPSTTYQELTTGLGVRPKYKNDVAFYHQHLTFFRVKPLYTWIAYGFHKIGFSLVDALLWVSLLSFIGIGLLFYFWIGKYMTPFLTFSVAVLTMLLSPVADLARDITPDALSNFFVLATMYTYCYLHRGWLIFFLISAILGRGDNFVLAGGIGFLLIFEKTIFSIFSFSKPQGIYGTVVQKNEVGWGIASILIGVVLFLIIPHLVGNTNEWLGKFSHTFSIKQYIYELMFSINAFRYSHFQLLLIIGIILLPLLKLFDRFEIKILLIILLTMGGRLVLFPSFQDRFFIAYELMALIVLTRLMWRWNQSNN